MPPACVTGQSPSQEGCQMASSGTVLESIQACFCKYSQICEISCIIWKEQGILYTHKRPSFGINIQYFQIKISVYPVPQNAGQP